ncbi:bis(5'-nucleosyl)-tetraphosphatase [Aliidiomarina sedimenti]|uniref:bis(5'-nucleosyl)-tetraphosphatase (symmetrical) n=1 Tax=Aliidiomarina sedimenti TaxID=1933879 RepID=A0ABY0BV11_9GAMM|nr:symmetrical bis(5'-nucleosyl)-tetraphosphatase [Aliidiomarina sedimenti]RUO27913.1 bis(5'-nucleosyl)-tetraphosphatase [Aliidiomarina sedimenti]
MAHYAVGDIHGCIDELKALLDKVAFDPVTDKLWSVGDLVGRGLHSQQVLQFAVELGDAFGCVLGNHDLHLLAVLCGVRQAHPKDNTDMIHQGKETEFWIEWLRQQPLMLHLPASDSVIVHAGVYPEWSLAQAQTLADEVSAQLQGDDYQDYLQQMYHNEPTRWCDKLTGIERFRFIVNAFTRMRFCRQEDDGLHLDLTSKLSPQQADADLLPWFNFYPPSPIQIMFGHWAALNGKTGREDIIALDTGCVWGNKLTLLNIDQQSFVTQAAFTDVK